MIRRDCDHGNEIFHSELLGEMPGITAGGDDSDRMLIIESLYECRRCFSPLDIGGYADQGDRMGRSAIQFC